VGRDNQLVENDVRRLQDEYGPYFSLFIVSRKERGTR
jgi:precorrin-2/cobalt-factor-2 C20-methyltransferase